MPIINPVCMRPSRVRVHCGLSDVAYIVPCSLWLTLACESIRAEIWPSRMRVVSSSSRADTEVLKAAAILRRSTLMYGLKY